jgi:phosphatidylglycerol lysyltransferase
VEARLRLLMLGVRPPAQADGILYGEAQRAAVPFRRLDGMLVALGDPAGAEADRISAVWRLCDLARQEGRDPAVYRAGPRLLKVYNDLGLTALPLGPNGLPVREGSPDSRASQHYLVCVAERDYAALYPLLPKLDAEAALTQPGGETAPSS